MMRKFPEVTLYMLQSIDGKICTGDTPDRDFDREFPEIPLLKKGMDTYYAYEKETDYWSMISGGTVCKLGINAEIWPSTFHECGHILLDSNDLTTRGIKYLANMCKDLIVVTDLPDKVPNLQNVKVLNVNPRKDIGAWLMWLYTDFGIDKITAQTGSAVNAALLKAGVVTTVELIVAPIFIGGKSTPSLVGGADAMFSASELSSNLWTLTKANKWPSNFIQLEYKRTGGLR